MALACLSVAHCIGRLEARENRWDNGKRGPKFSGQSLSGEHRTTSWDHEGAVAAVFMQTLKGSIHTGARGTQQRQGKHWAPPSCSSRKKREGGGRTSGGTACGGWVWRNCEILGDPLPSSCYGGAGKAPRLPWFTLSPPPLSWTFCRSKEITWPKWGDGQKDPWLRASSLAGSAARSPLPWV